MGWKEGVIVICAPCLPLCPASQRREGASPGPYVTATPLRPPASEHGSVHLGYVFHGLTSPSVVLQRSWEKMRGNSRMPNRRRPSFQRTRIRPLLSVPKAQPALVPCPLPLQCPIPHSLRLWPRPASTYCLSFHLILHP